MKKELSKTEKLALTKDLNAFANDYLLRKGRREAPGVRFFPHPDAWPRDMFAYGGFTEFVKVLEKHFEES